MTPQRVTLITLGVGNIASSRAFYEALGWVPASVQEGVAFYQMHGAVLALFGRCLLYTSRASDRKITIEEIQRKVSEHFNIRLSDMIGPKRTRTIARPRQVAMYLAKQITTRSLPDIGRRFGGRDHTTIMHGVRVIEEMKLTDHQLAEDVELLRRLLES